MIGLFQEHGPCHFADGSSKPSLNQYSWNTYANMLYVDQVSQRPLPEARRLQR
jgi:carboxypeptidase D